MEDFMRGYPNRVNNNDFWSVVRARFKLRGFDLPEHVRFDPLFPLLQASYSAKLGRPVGCEQRYLIELANTLFNSHKPALWVFTAMMGFYDRGALLTVGLYHHVDFGLDARELSTFGEATDYASLLIVAGPVADVTVTTPHTEALRLIGHNRRDEITPEMDVDVVIAEFCANPPTKDPSEDGKLRAAEGETSTLEWETLNRDNWLAANAAPPSH